MMMKPFFVAACLLATFALQAQAPGLLKQNGIRIGVMPAGRLNAITDVQGVKVGQVTIVQGDSVRTGVTSILPHGGNLFQQKVPAAVFVGNGFGKLAGTTQIAELGTIESPIVLTNTLSVAAGIQGIIDYTLQQPGNEKVQSVNAVVGETNDGYLNDIRGMHVSKAQVLQSMLQADTGVLAQGNVGAGTGTVCFGWKGGIGTASRQLPANLGGYTVGVLVQTNFGGVLEIAGVPVGQLLQKYALKDELNHTPDGSCMIVVATDAPLDARNLERLAKRAFMGLAKTGGIASNGSGDYVIAFSTANKVPHHPTAVVVPAQYLHNEATTPLFMAAIEATEEAIINSLFAAATMKGKAGRTIEALPKEKVISLIQQYKRGNGQ